MVTSAGLPDRPASGGASGRPLILIVDDDPAFRRTVALALTRLGALTFGAANGLDAFRLAQRQGADAIVTGLSVPGLDAAGLIRRLRDHPWGRATPVVVVSRQADPPAVSAELFGPAVFVVSRSDGLGPVVAHLASVLGMERALRRMGS
jgi:phosphoserine phosphatase RsbU/P